MDTVTQIALGAAVTEAAIGKYVGRKALLWGAVAGTLPDLDVFIPFDDPVKDFTYHRSFSHSIFFLTLLAPVLSSLITRIYPTTRARRSRWRWAIWLALITHPLLDCFTVYGTQLFWPLTDYPITWSTLFIIDPLYTAPLLVGVISVLITGRSVETARRLNKLGLALSSAYLVFTVGAKLYVEHITASSLQRQQIAHTQYLTTASPFNTLLWRIVVMDRTGYREGFYSLLDRSNTIRWARYPSRDNLLNGIEDKWAVQRLRWFTKGFYRVIDHNGAIVMTDLRMGQEPAYIFSFKVGEQGDGSVLPVPTERYLSERIDPVQATWVWDRIWDETAGPAP